MNEYSFNLSDEHVIEIVDLARGGDEVAFETLFREYYAHIFRHLVRMVSNEQDAIDLTQETFIKAWRGLPNLYDRHKFRSWLYSIATHSALDYLRYKRSRQNFWEHPEEDDPYESMAEVESRIEEQERIKLALWKIVPRAKACLLLQLEGFSLAEIAEQSGLDRKSVSTYISLGREQFRKAYSRMK